MNLYEKVLTSSYYYKRNSLYPTKYTIHIISFIHIINIFCISIKLGFNLKNIDSFFGGIFLVVIFWFLTLLHEEFLLSEESFDDRLKCLNPQSIKKYDYLYLIYKLLTGAFVFYVFDIYWGNYFYVCLALIGFNAIYRIISEIK
ncbi:hypothetical protein WH52_02130 [Tenacibaculum holothuriorum]|uniref:Uncharacterized protein n=1 Tax=Tenacibaculum holothuriorum TaxID=1635173 RepID=A0A1Y2PG97_9FLAO|nr:hypothetical protein [Tenacibaculum holothuriorum]OSY89455.1 hypothetical protein WH52_02130 [Tenacibaculum holothuriorum]